MIAYASSGRIVRGFLGGEGPGRRTQSFACGGVARGRDWVVAGRPGEGEDEELDHPRKWRSGVAWLGSFIVLPFGQREELIMDGWVVDDGEVDVVG